MSGYRENLEMNGKLSDEAMAANSMESESLSFLNSKHDFNDSASSSLNKLARVIITPEQSDEEQSIETRLEDDELDQDNGLDENESIKSSSSSTSSWCSSVETIPVIRPEPRRASSPTPEVAFLCLSGSPPCHFSGPIGKGRTEKTQLFSHNSSCFASIGSGFDSVYDALRNSCVHRDSHVVSPEKLRNNNENMNALNSTNETLGINSIYPHSVGLNRSPRFKPEKRYPKSSTFQFEDGKEPNISFHSALWQRRRIRLVSSRKRSKRRTSPVFDNMPVVPESPTVCNSSFDESDSDDDSPVPSSPSVNKVEVKYVNDEKSKTVSPSTVCDHAGPENSPKYGIEKAVSFATDEIDAGLLSTTKFNCNTGETSNLSEKINAQESIFNHEQNAPCVGLQSSFLVKESVHETDQGFSSVFRFNEKCNVPQVVTLNHDRDEHNDDHSISSCTSHSMSYTFESIKSRQLFSSSHSVHTHQSKISSVKSFSSASISLPILIGPAYKFTPIDRDFSYDSTDSYEPQGNASDSDSLLANHDFNYENYDEMRKECITYEERQQQHVLGVKKDVVEEWSIFDLPCLMSRTICDWIDFQNPSTKCGVN